MIFVTVGTHEQPFDRLIECIDNLKKKETLKKKLLYKLDLVLTNLSTVSGKTCYHINKW